MNILEKANEIVNLRKEEKERQYGPMAESMDKAALMASIMANKEITAEDVHIVLVALKLSRHSYGYKEDNLLDAVAYLGGLNNYIQANE
jgi:DNA-binding protein H-NS